MERGGHFLYNGRLLCFSLGAIAIQCAGPGTSSSLGGGAGLGVGGGLRGALSGAKRQSGSQQSGDWQSLPALLAEKRRIKLTIEYVGTEYSGWQRCVPAPHACIIAGRCPSLNFIQCDAVR